jgi:hypothetical protein
MVSAAKAAPTTEVVQAAADVVSRLAATQFAAHAGRYRPVNAQATVVDDLCLTANQTGAGTPSVICTANSTAVN